VRNRVLVVFFLVYLTACDSVRGMTSPNFATVNRSAVRVEAIPPPDDCGAAAQSLSKKGGKQTITGNC
jgi:hypothetical protein